MTSKKKKIGLIIGSGDLAIYCVEKLVNLGHEIVVLRLPCSQIKIRRGIKKSIYDMKKLVRHSRI